MISIAVIGLGQMGTTLARLLVAGGHQVRVWNRTRGKASPLVALGALAAATAAEAIAGAEVAIVCVHDYAASDSVLRNSEAEAALRGKLLIQLSTGSPEDARRSEEWARRIGAAYLDGAIQVAPSQMDRPDTTILVSGAEAAFGNAGEVLRVFGGNIKYLGERIEAAATMDLATLSYVYGTFVGFLQGALFCKWQGLSLDAYGDIVQAISPSYGEFLKYEAEVIRKGDFTVSESPLSISWAATERIEQIARGAGVSAEFPDLMAGLFRRAMEAGLGHEEVAALIKVMR